jgi:hypothetical protein
VTFVAVIMVVAIVGAIVLSGAGRRRPFDKPVGGP